MRVGERQSVALREYAEQFEGLLGWWQNRWSAIAVAMEQAGFRWGPFRQREVARSTPTTPFEQDGRILAEPLPQAVRTRSGVARRQLASRNLSELESSLDRFTGPACARLLTAIQARDADRRNFEKGYETVAAHGQLTRTGQLALDAARAYMSAAA